MTSVTFTRAALSKAPLVVTFNPHGTTLHLPEDGIGAVAWDYRRGYAPDSGWASGKALLSAVREATAQPLTIYAHGDTSTELEAAREELEEAAGQWSYDLIVEVDGVSWTYNAEPAIPQWAAFDSGMVAAHMDRCQLVIPINP